MDNLKIYYDFKSSRDTKSFAIYPQKFFLNYTAFGYNFVVLFKKLKYLKEYDDWKSTILVEDHKYSIDYKHFMMLRAKGHFLYKGVNFDGQAILSKKQHYPNISNEFLFSLVIYMFLKFFHYIEIRNLACKMNNVFILK